VTRRQLTSRPCSPFGVFAAVLPENCAARRDLLLPSRLTDLRGDQACRERVDKDYAARCTAESDATTEENAKGGWAISAWSHGLVIRPATAKSLKQPDHEVKRWRTCARSRHARELK
jgi:hypothetical protein